MRRAKKKKTESDGEKSVIPEKDSGLAQTRRDKPPDPRHVSLLSELVRCGPPPERVERTRKCATCPTLLSPYNKSDRCSACQSNAIDAFCNAEATEPDEEDDDDA